MSAGLSVWLLNWLYRVGVAGERERDQEDHAREFFDRHGVWPDEVSAEDRARLEDPRSDERRTSPHRTAPSRPPARRR